MSNAAPGVVAIMKTTSIVLMANAERSGGDKGDAGVGHINEAGVVEVTADELVSAHSAEPRCVLVCHASRAVNDSPLHGRGQEGGEVNIQASWWCVSSRRKTSHFRRSPIILLWGRARERAMPDQYLSPFAAFRHLARARHRRDNFSFLPFRKIHFCDTKEKIKLKEKINRQSVSFFICGARGLVLLTWHFRPAAPHDQEDLFAGLP
jgi:hypothetical protein